VDLHDDGLFAFETRNPRWTTTDRVTASPPGSGLFTFLETHAEEEECHTITDSQGREVRAPRRQSYDQVTQILPLTSYQRWLECDQEQSRIIRIALRYTFLQESTALLHDHGFAIVRRYGDWNLEPLSGASRSMIVVCRKRAERDDARLW